MTGSVPAPGRRSWVDLAKGGAIILVVLYHASIFVPLTGLAPVWVPGASALDVARMPLFFFVSGIFAGRMVARPFAVVMRSRVLMLLWLFALWSTIWFVVFYLVPPLGGNAVSVSPTAHLLLLVRPNENTWFLYALALYTLVAWLLRRFPILVQLGLALVLAQLFQLDIIEVDRVAVAKIATNLLWFLLALHIGPWLLGHAERARWWHATGLAFAFVVAMTQLPDGSLDLPFVRPVVEAVAVAAGCATAVVLSRCRPLAPLSTLGRHTLPVYVLHFYPVLAVCYLIDPVADDLPDLVAWALPPVLTAIALALSLLLWRLTRGIDFLWGLPRQWRLPRTAVA